MNNVAFGRYVPYDSKIHRLDPRFKLLAMIIFMVSIFIRFPGSNDVIYMNFIMYGIIAIIVFIIMAIAHIRLLDLFKQLKSLWFMVLILLIVNVLLPNEGPYFSIFGTIKIYHNALYNTAYIFIRLVLMISLAMILTGTTAPLDLTYALEWYLTPLKVIKFPTHEIAMTISIALRFIPTLLDETDRIMKAQASRGVDFQNGKFKEKIRAIISLIVPLLVSAFQRSEELANAMEARGYNPGAKRTRYRILKWKLRDWIALLLLALFFAAILYISIAKIDFVVLISSLIGG